MAAMFDPHPGDLKYYLQLSRELLTLPKLQWNLRTFPLRWKVQTHAYGSHPQQHLWQIVPEVAIKGVLVFFHGGGWIFGDQRMLAPAIHEWAAEGWMVLAPAYRKLPRYSVPHNLEDLDALVDWMANAPENILPAKLPIILGGMSAGGHLAALASLDADRHQRFYFESSRIKGLLLLAPPLSLMHMPKTPVLNWYLAKTRQKDLHGWDPVQLLPLMPKTPLLLIHGTNDQTVPPVASRVFTEQYLGPKSIHYLDGLGHYDLPYWGIGKQPLIKNLVMDWLRTMEQK